MAVPYTLKRYFDTYQKLSLTVIILLAFLGYGILCGYFPLVGIAIVFGGAYFAVAFARPVWLTLAYIFTVPLGLLLAVPVSPGGLKLSTMILLTAFLPWMVRSLLAKDRDLFITPLSKLLHILVISILIIAFISLINTRNLEGAWLELQQLIYCVAAYFLIIFTVKERKTLDLVVTTILLSGLVAAAIGMMEGITGTTVYQYLGNKSLLGTDLPTRLLFPLEGRISGPMGTPDSHSFNMVPVFLLALYSLYITRSRAMKLSLLLLMFLCVFNMIGAGTRGAVIAFGVSLLVLFRFMDIPRKGLILAIAIVLIIATFLFMQAILPELVIERYYDPSVGKGEQTFKVRILMTIKALEMFPEHPIIGHGPHGFIIETRAEPGYRFANVHNGYLQVLTSLGLLGLGICALIFIILFRSLLKLVESLSGKYRYLSIAALGWFAGYCVYMLNDPAFFHDYHWYLIGLIVAFCSIQERIEGRRIVL